MTDTHPAVEPILPITDDHLDALAERVLGRLEARLQPVFHEHVEQGKRQLAFDLRSQFAALSMSAAGELLRLRKEHRQALAQAFDEERDTWRTALSEERDGQVRALRTEVVTAAEDALAAVATQWLNESRDQLEREAAALTVRLTEQLSASVTATLHSRLDELLATRQQALTDHLTEQAAQQLADQLQQMTSDSLKRLRDGVCAEGNGLLWELQERLEKTYAQTREALPAQCADVAQTALAQFEQQLSAQQAAAAHALEGVWNAWSDQRQQQFAQDVQGLCEQQLAQALQPQQAVLQAALQAEAERLRVLLAEHARADVAVHAEAEAERLAGDLDDRLRAGLQSQRAVWRGELDTHLADLAGQVRSLQDHTVTAAHLERELAAIQTQLTVLNEQLGRLTQSTRTVVQRLQAHTQTQLATLQAQDQTLAEQQTQMAELLQQLAAAQEVSAAFVQWYRTARLSARLLGRYPQPGADHPA